MEQIISGNQVLQCAVNANPSDYQNDYNSSEECITELTPLIIEDGKSRGYSDQEISKVVTHYEVKFNNANGSWSNDFE